MCERTGTGTFLQPCSERFWEVFSAQCVVVHVSSCQKGMARANSAILNMVAPIRPILLSYIPVDANAEHPVLAGGLAKQGAERVPLLGYSAAKRSEK